MNKLTKPWSVQVELVEGCNRRCWFCGINGIRDKNRRYNYMSVDIVYRLLQGFKEFCPNSRYEFAMHGEPTLHPDYLRIFKEFRRSLPNTQLQLTTNSTIFTRSQEFMQEQVMEIFDSGVNFIIMDTYKPNRDKLQNMIHDLKDCDIIDFYNQGISNFSPWYNYHDKIHNTIVIMDDLGERNKEIKSRTIYNHAGNATGVDTKGTIFPLKKTCTLPFREISFRWDGSVSICCQDWGDEYHIGNIQHSKIEQLWNSDRFEVARKFLRNKLRLFSPCSRCNIGSGARSGLLPLYDYPNVQDVSKINFVVEDSSKLYKINSLESKYVWDGEL